MIRHLIIILIFNKNKFSEFEYEEKNLMLTEPGYLRFC